MSALGIIALITGIAGVWLTIKQNIWCWPIGLVSVLSSLIEFYEQRLFGDAALQIIYFIAAIYGWYFWNAKRNETFKVKYFNKKHWPILVLITVAQSVLYFYLLRYLKSDKVLADAILTACSLSATYMMTKKWVENWFVWVIIDSAYVFLYISKAMWSFALLYGIFALVAYYGWIKWKNISQ